MAAQPKKTVSHLSRERVVTELSLAKQAFKRSGFVVGSPKWTSTDFQDLGLFSAEEQSLALGSALDELTPEAYNGPHPPNHISKEPKCAGKRMLQFSWESSFWGSKRMYLKFCLAGDRFLLIRFHPDYQPNRFDG